MKRIKELLSLLGMCSDSERDKEIVIEVCREIEESEIKKKRKEK